MIRTTQQELDSSIQLAQSRLQGGGTEPSLDELFDLWRIENRCVPSRSPRRTRWS
ncbi:MAG: hypothetical protein HUU20_17235 [Pirellulales bacterium]|nr:hypothetical protein [Pirellulales bacterium]